MRAEELQYQDIITIDRLFQAWDEFKKEKRSKKDVQVFERHLEDNLFSLHISLKNKTYQHGSYQDFYVSDPKRRHIHKSDVKDRVLHHLLYKYLYEIFDKQFIFDSYSCRKDKGTHKAVKRLEKFARIVSKNYTKNCWALKCDVKKFFASVDHVILKSLISKQVKDKDIVGLLNIVIDSFASDLGKGKGIPLGNLTSQIFANIYLDELDQFVKHTLKIKYYVRYADDFLIVNTSSDNNWKEAYLLSITYFLKNNLKVNLHPRKISTRKLTWGIDFCGYIVLPYYILPRTKTKKRIFRKITIKISENKSGKISDFSLNQTVQSYLGYFSHANSYKIVKQFRSQI